MRHAATQSSLREIADEAGVSLRTVARILQGGNKEVWPSAMKRAAQVRQIAERLNYRPNAAAKAVSTGRFNSVALLSGSRSPGVLSPFLLHELDHSLMTRDMHLIVARVPDADLTSESRMPRLLRELAADGLLIHYQHHFPEQMLSLIRRLRIPSVWLNNKQPVNAVYPDDVHGAETATRALIEAGHRDITYVSFQSFGHYSEEERIAGYETAMRAAGLLPRVYLRRSTFLDPAPADTRRQLAEQFIAAPDRPTAVLTYNAGTAGPLLTSALSARLRVPEDLSIVTFHESTVTDTGYAFASALIPQADVARTAVEMLIGLIADPAASAPSRAIPMPFVAGQTLARVCESPPPKARSAGSPTASHAPPPRESPTAR